LISQSPKGKKNYTRKYAQCVGTVLCPSAFRRNLRQKLNELSFGVFREDVQYCNVSQACKVVWVIEASNEVQVVALSDAWKPSQSSNAQIVEDNALVTLATCALAGSGHFGIWFWRDRENVKSN
jgi:hypothetical protein